MGYDGKYGKVATEHGDIPDDEPVIVFRAQDRLSVSVLRAYFELCRVAGSPQRHLSLVSGTIRRFTDWQEAHPGQLKVPDSERSRAWLPEA
jgi:hypothetical protein